MIVKVSKNYRQCAEGRSFKDYNDIRRILHISASKTMFWSVDVIVVAVVVLGFMLRI